MGPINQGLFLSIKCSFKNLYISVGFLSGGWIFGRFPKGGVPKNQKTISQGTVEDLTFAPWIGLWFLGFTHFWSKDVNVMWYLCLDFGFAMNDYFHRVAFSLLTNMHFSSSVRYDWITASTQKSPQNQRCIYSSSVQTQTPSRKLTNIPHWIISRTPWKM